ncbi:hypothetical protein [Leptospira kanakyensis]|uniref:hypothetical protein n=1 Tax=Leptospira kanakyensis TaxID=2484968 RepID=UPI00223D4B09|nr:hypothetical protein [Leptospira kanakyensis]MCW7469575.1 hypothetical protein [Leptospira kanakyensis]MCW7480563.1 hypothetical protein [Leptospira kanakyensis]
MKISRSFTKINYFIFGIFLTLFLLLHCNTNETTNTKDQLTILSIISVANNLTNSPSERIPTTSCNTEKGNPISLDLNVSTTHTIINKDLCYFFTTSPVTRTNIIKLNPIANSDSSSSNTDLAALRGSSIGGDKPATTWSGTGANCTPFGWQNCVSNSGLTIESISLTSSAGDQIAIGVYGIDCSRFDGCKFSIIIE